MDNAYLKKTWQKARDALAKRDFRAALALLQKIKKSIPVDADVQFALAEAQAGVGRLPDAIRECRAGVERVPSAPEGWIHLGRLCLATADGHQALEAAPNDIGPVAPKATNFGTISNTVRFHQIASGSLCGPSIHRAQENRVAG